MASGAVELMRERYETLNRVLATGEEMVAPAWFDPDIVVEMGVLEGSFHGPDGFIRFIEGQAALLDDLRCEPKEFIEAGDHMVVPMRLTGKARSNGMPFEYQAVHVWTLKDGSTATHVRLYDTKAKALEAVGVVE